MENTIENKVKFFALYWGQNVAVFKDESRSKVNTTIWNRLGVPAIDWIEFLELKSLSNISDEDAIEVFNFMYPNHLPTSEDEKIETIKGVFESVYRPYKFLGLTESVHFIDKCRSLCYALPFMGISVKQMIEWNWIKIIE